MASDEAEHQRVSELFARVVGNSKSFVSGSLSIDESTESAAVQLVWGGTDLVNSVTHKYQTHHHVSALCQSQPNVIATGFPRIDSSDCTSVSPSGKYLVTLKLEKTQNDGTPEGLFCGTRLNFFGFFQQLLTF
ncbi:hypothetical protein CCR75_009268 [Bremia lactucae]|uniref:Uncharacterized protein n=1 Tax=Bremia lactucae TaxID=4779 RepID=A0A976IHM2_BRELC|nr:hypothetical protein CCR75_009268 [Bremia lactucae]